jgi:hypothetical protein
MKTRHLLTAALAAAGAATVLLSSGTANADTPVPAWMQPSLASYGVPMTAPDYVPGGDLLPQIPGTLGNPVQLLMNSQNQAIGAPDANWGTELQTQDAQQGATSQTFYFERMGTVHVNLPNGFAGVGVYRILHYSSSGVTCMDGLGGSPAAWTPIGLYGCDPNHAGQTNQLWIIGRIDDQVAQGSEQSINAALTYAFGESGADSAAYTIENLSTVVDNNATTSATPVLSATESNLRGYHSGIDLASQTGVAFDFNSMWNVVSAVIPKAANTNPSKPNCVGIACLLK